MSPNPAGPGASAAGTVRRVTPLVIMMALAASSVWLAYYALFSSFLAHDDEGYMMLSVRFLLEDKVLYDHVFTPYGPVYFMYKWLLHAPLGLPLTHDATRLLTILHWTGLGLTCAWIVAKESRSLAFGAVAYGAVVAFASAFRNEPGHTQEIVASLAAAIPLIGLRGAGETTLRRWWVGGLLAGAVLMAKANVGVFCLAALGTVLAAETRNGRARRLLVPGVALITLAFPFSLMWELLSHEGCVHLAIVSTAALAAALVAVVGGSARRVSLGHYAATALGVLTAAVVSLGFAATQGSTPQGLASSIWHYAIGNQYLFAFKSYSTLQLALALVAPLAAAVCVRARTSSRGESLVALMKAAFGIAAICCALFSGGVEAIGWLAPWAWLCAIPRRNEEVSTGRLILASLAAWHVLLAYPVAGSQVMFASFLVVTSGVLAAADAAAALAAQLATPSAQGESRAEPVTARIGWTVCAGIVVLLAFVGAGHHKRYSRGEPIGVAGTKLMRIEPERARRYHQLANEVAGADVVFTTTGLNSLYLWTGAEPPADVLVAEDLRRLRAEDHRAIIDGLAHAQRPIVVLTNPMFGELPQIEVVVWIEEHFEAYTSVGPYVLMKRRDAHTRL